MENSKNGHSLMTTPTLISKGCVVHGNIESDVFVRIEGNVKGDLFIRGGLIIGENGLIEGNIQANEIIVYGTVNGSVKSGSIDIKGSGKVTGELFAVSLQLEKGAVYAGTVSMEKKTLRP